MTRADKIRKLANAIKDYRGLYRESNGVWIYPPKHSALARVELWIGRLNLPVKATVEAINNFHNVREYHAWIQAL